MKLDTYYIKKIEMPIWSRRDQEYKDKYYMIYDDYNHQPISSNCYLTYEAAVRALEGYVSGF